MKKIGYILLLIGIAVLAFHIIYNKHLENNNKEIVDKYIENTSVIVDNIKEEVQEEVNEKINEIDIEEKQNITYRIDYTAVLEIPSINLRRGVVDCTSGFNSLYYAISVDKSSNYPNEKGNFILYAHAGSSSYAFFKKLVNVEINDNVYVYYNGIKYHYIIFDKYDIEKTGKASIVSPNDDNYITLITCNIAKKGYQTILIGKLIDNVDY